MIVMNAHATMRADQFCNPYTKQQIMRVLFICCAKRPAGRRT